ncbi:MAG: aminopeptidase P family protein [Candidatus Gastranaerophilales bacterium]|nr:aminopeptidase P family protein [Candidatus Gastranaerophilales bacterium]
MDLKTLGVDYLLVNATNRFLLEYAPIEENSCHNLTGFTGDTGDALVCSDGKIFLFVDGRYHSQADLEVDHDKVTVIKLKLGQKQDEEICAHIKPETTLGVVSYKISQKRLDFFKTLLKEIGSSVKCLNVDIYEKPFTASIAKPQILPVELTGEDFNSKIQKLKKPQLITNSEELTYVCNIRNFSQNYAVKVDGKLFLSNDENILFTGAVFDEPVEFEVQPLENFDEFIRGIASPVIVDKSSITAYDCSLIKNPEYETSQVKMIKSVKNKTEIEHLKHCFEMTDKALFATRNFIYNNAGLSEYDIDVELEKNFKKYGAKLLSFKSIVARNRNAALAHYMKSSKNEIVKDGDLILIDCGAYYDGGLATDITRVFVKGESNTLHKKVYTTVLKMFLSAYNYNVKPEITTGFEIDRHAREVLSDNPVKDFVFSHGLGHGIGVCVHEIPPNLSMNDIAKTPIKNNMCFTIEPGLYCNKHFGIRLENSCYLDNGRIKSLSNMCFEKKLIDYTVLTENELKWLECFEVV